MKQRPPQGSASYLSQHIYNTQTSYSHINPVKKVLLHCKQQFILASIRIRPCLEAAQKMWRVLAANGHSSIQRHALLICFFPAITLVPTEQMKTLFFHCCIYWIYIIGYCIFGIAFLCGFLSSHCDDQQHAGSFFANNCVK